MNNIDFLPERYRELRTARRSNVWRWAVLVVFGVAVGATAVGQQVLRSSVAAKVDAVGRQYTAAQERNSQFSQLQLRLKQARAGAQLYAYLKHPWPRSQILAAVVEPLPPEVTLLDVSIASETPEDAQRNEVSGRARRRREREEAETRLLPAERDLKQLREEFERFGTVVRVSGRTADIDKLHEYVSSLSRSPLVAQAEFSSLESARDAADQGISDFHLRVLVIAAHGRPETSPASAAAGRDG